MSLPLAAWALSALTFLVGTVVTPLYNRLAYDGISISQKRDYTVASGVKDLITYKARLKIANVTKSPVAIDDIQTNLQRLTRVPIRLVGARAWIIQHSSVGASLVAYKGTIEFPILLAPESSTVVEYELAYLPEGFLGPVKNDSAGDAYRAVSSTLLKAASDAHLVVYVLINGKLRSLQIEPRASWLGSDDSEPGN